MDNDSAAAEGPVPHEAKAASSEPKLRRLPLRLIISGPNPRRAAYRRGVSSAGQDGTYSGADLPMLSDPELEGLARSIGTEEEPRLAEPPVVEELPGGTYRLCAGERRVEAARLAGWSSIPCLVYPPMDPARVHLLGLVENIQRVPMHPLDEISALCISRLVANADARGLSQEARSILRDASDQGNSSYATMMKLEAMLLEAGWVAERPDVSWKAHLDDLGISMAPWERKRKLRMLSIEPQLQEKLRSLDITEAALRSLGTLQAEDQRRVVEALVNNPSLARKVRRVARARRDGFYETIEDALAEVQGLTRREDGSNDDQSGRIGSGPIGSGSPPSGDISDQAATPASLTSPTSPASRPAAAATNLRPLSPMSTNSNQMVNLLPSEATDAVLQLLECADRFSSAMTTLRKYSPGRDLPEPWNSWWLEAVKFFAEQLAAEKAQRHDLW